MHLILRVPVTGAALEEIAERHLEVLSKHGAVWVGIRTCFISERLRVLMETQKKNSIPTFLYLMQRSGKSFAAYKGTFSTSTNYMYPGMPKLMPSYYADLLDGFKSWIKVTTLVPVKESEIVRLAMYTTGTQLIHVLRTSMLSFGSVYLADCEVNKKVAEKKLGTYY
jgi:hypothetical protein